MGRRGYPPAFRRRVLDLVETGRSVADVAPDPDISQQSIYVWRGQDRIDRGLEPGTTSVEQAELAEARRRIAQLETQVAIATRAVEQLKEQTGPREGGSRRSE